MVVNDIFVDCLKYIISYNRNVLVQQFFFLYISTTKSLYSSFEKLRTILERIGEFRPTKKYLLELFVGNISQINENGNWVCDLDKIYGRRPDGKLIFLVSCVQ